MTFYIGRFQWKRLPIDIVIANDIFQKKLYSVCIGLPGFTGIADDMIIYCRTEKEHDKKLISLSRNYKKEWAGSQQEETSIWA